jgi:hypothetical protein
LLLLLTDIKALWASDWGPARLAQCHVVMSGRKSWGFSRKPQSPTRSALFFQAPAVASSATTPRQAKPISIPAIAAPASKMQKSHAIRQPVKTVRVTVAFWDVFMLPPVKCAPIGQHHFSKARWQRHARDMAKRR